MDEVTDSVKCTVTGRECVGDDGALWCTCVGCTVWRTREASAVPAYEFIVRQIDGKLCLCALPTDSSFPEDRVERTSLGEVS